MIVDFLGNELTAGDIVLRVGAESGYFTWSKIIDFRTVTEYGRVVNKVGVISADIWPSTIKITSKTGWTFPERCVKMNPPQNIKEAFENANR